MVKTIFKLTKNFDFSVYYNEAKPFDWTLFIFALDLVILGGLYIVIFYLISKYKKLLDESLKIVEESRELIALYKKEGCKKFGECWRNQEIVIFDFYFFVQEVITLIQMVNDFEFPSFKC